MYKRLVTGTGRPTMQKVMTINEITIAKDEAKIHCNGCDNKPPDYSSFACFSIPLADAPFYRVGQPLYINVTTSVSDGEPRNWIDRGVSAAEAAVDRCAPVEA